MSLREFDFFCAGNGADIKVRRLDGAVELTANSPGYVVLRFTFAEWEQFCTVAKSIDTTPGRL